MPSTSALQRPRLFVFLVGLAAFAVLTLRYSPNWVAFSAFVREATSEVTTPSHRTAIEEAVLSGFSERGLHVIRQARDLSAEIRDSNHKIVRWRLLIPAVGHMLRLPDWCTLGLAHLGCLAWIVALVELGRRQARQAGRSPFEAFALAIVAGASAPFFASMGLLGYYDSWLVLALLVVAFAPNRGWVLAACVLGPWIDERFVIGLPLALSVRWFRSEPDPATAWPWFRREACLPLALALGYALLRLKLGGSGSSQTVGEYFRQFVLNPKVGASDRLVGAWSGLQIGWILVGAAIVLVGLNRKYRHYLPTTLLAAAVAGTALVGLFTALDLSRSMALLTPVVPLGWGLANRHQAWARWHLAPVLAATALLVPAYHVMGTSRLKVDNVFHASVPLLTAQNNLGLLYDKGERVPRDVAKSKQWYQQAADAGHAESQNNLAAKYIMGDGVPKDYPRALALLRDAVRQDNLSAIYNYGHLYAEGIGVPKDPTAAAHWYRIAADRGFTNAMNNLGAMYLDGTGVPKNPTEAIRWYTRAVYKGQATSALNLGYIFQSGADVPRDLISAYHWFLIGGVLGDATAREQAAALERHLPPAALAQGRKRAEQTVAELRKKA